MDIPVPERCYWNKPRPGNAVKRTPLAPRDLGTANSVEMSGALTPGTARPGFCAAQLSERASLHR